jgi:hypothetical protein
MKILLYNEFSGLHQNLADGLKSLGHIPIIASGGDSWKNFSNDISLLPNKKTKIERFLYRLKLINRLTGFDVIQILGGITVYGNKVIDNSIINYILKHNSKSFYLAAGCDSEFLKSSNKYLTEASPCPQCIKEDSCDNRCTIRLDSEYFTTNSASIVNNVNQVIPTMIEYQFGYQDIQNLGKIIRMPLNRKKYPWTENRVNHRIKILHGINRPGFKGSTLIIDTLKKLQQKYPNDVELILPTRLPISEYLKLVEESNIVVDQCFGYSLGMNALISMSMGKVVFHGFNYRNQDEYLNSKPTINFNNNSEFLSSEIYNLMENKSKVAELGYLSGKFIKMHHDHIKIAQQFVENWKEQ